jgi:hypothetical protein
MSPLYSLLIAGVCCAPPSTDPAKPQEKPPKGVPVAYLHFEPLSDKDKHESQFARPRASILNYVEVIRSVDATYDPVLRDLLPELFFAKVWIKRADALLIVQKNGRPALAWGLLKVKFRRTGSRRGGNDRADLESVFLLPETKLITAGK